MAWSQNPIPLRQARQRQDIPDLDLRRVDDDALDQQLDQFAPLGEGRPLQPLRHAGPEGLDLLHDAAEPPLLRRGRQQFPLLPAHGIQALRQGPPPGLQFLQRDGLGGVGVDESLDLALQLLAPLVEAVPAARHRAIVEPALLRPAQGLIEDGGIAQQGAQVRPDRGVQALDADVPRRAAVRAPAHHLGVLAGALVVDVAALVVDAVG